MNWRDRVKELRRVPASELKANPRNWREHPDDQRKALGGVLDEVGIAGALIARETDDGLELIDGHLRTDMDDATEWPVLILDVDEAEADLLLATLDPIGAMASKNEEQLKELLSDLDAQSEGLAEMLDSMAQDLEEWNTDFDLDGIEGHTDGIESKIVVECAQVDADAVRQIIVEAIKAGGFLDVVKIK